MPWPWELCERLYDPMASHLQGRAVFRPPYPQGNWYEEKRWNDFPLQAMRVTWLADQLFTKRDDGKAWDKDDDRLFLWIADGEKRFDAGQQLAERLAETLGFIEVP